MNIKVDIRGVQETSAYLAGTKRQIDLATTRAIRSTLKWCRVRIKKDGAAALKVKQKALTRRIRTSNIKNGDQSGTLWAGTWNLSPYVVGTPRQIGAKSVGGKKARSLLGGVGLGRDRFYRGAFLGKIYGGRENIWIRLSSGHFNPLLFPGGMKYGSSKFQGGRFPVVKASIATDEVMALVFDRDADEIREQFHKRLRKEVNYAVNFEGPKLR